MILVIWSSERANELAAAIQSEFNQPLRIVTNLEQAQEELRSGSFSAVLIDQWAQDGMPGMADLLYEELGTAVPVVVNLAVSSSDRVLRAVRAALRQQERELRLARQNASSRLTAELKDQLTAVLLSCGLALQDATLTLPVAIRLRNIEEAANQIRRKLAGEEQQEGMHA